MKVVFEYEDKNLLVLAEDATEYQRIKTWMQNFMADRPMYSISYTMVDQQLRKHLEA